jgi:hypothetical protein
MKSADDEVYRQLVEQAIRISRLADQARDRTIKVHLIELTYKLLDVTNILLDVTKIGRHFEMLSGNAETACGG